LVNKTTVSAATANREKPQPGKWWWVPSTVVILSLLVLLIVPATIDRRATALRDSVTAGEQARTALNDFEASLATELLLRAGPPTQAGALHVSEDTLEADLTVLRSTLRHIDGDGVARYDSLSSLLGAWRASLRDGGRGSVQDGLRLIGAADTLDAYLTQFVETRRAKLVAVSRYFVAIPATLAPIAVLAMLLSMWMARRGQLFARIAEGERAEVVRAAESRAALLRGVTHDVKNPLGAANGYAQLLEEGMVGPMVEAQAVMVRRIRHLLGTSIQTVTDLLELARADGTLHLEYAQTDLAQTMNEVVDDHSGLALEHGVSLAAVSSTAPAPVMTDPVRVRQILGNLITNAIKYTPHGGSVRARIVRAKLDGHADRVGVAVEDTGPGIPRELEPRLFEEFFRVSTDASGSGNGLGLAISRRIGRLLGGDVTYQRTDGPGSVFTVWLPDDRR
jgi:signal transduction histidine kinase